MDVNDDVSIDNAISRIINTGSLAGLIPIPFQAFYSASKYAVESLTEALRIELLSFGIRVVLIEPGDFKIRYTTGKMSRILPVKLRKYIPHRLSEYLLMKYYGLL